MTERRMHAYYYSFDSTGCDPVDKILSAVDEIVSFWEPGLLDMAENQKNHEYAAAYCAQHGFILNLQIHLYASLA